MSKIDTSKPETWRWITAGTSRNPDGRLICKAAMSMSGFILMAEAIELDTTRRFVQVAKCKVFEENLAYIHDLQDGAPISTFSLNERTYVLHLTPTKL